MKRTLSAGLLLLALLVVVRPAHAQDESLTLGLSRDFGYAGFSSDIEGLFSLSAQGPNDLTRVDFYFNDEIIFSDDAAPFRFQFTTKDYAPGEYRLYAIGVTADGTELHSNEFVRVFLSAEDARG
ncbi:MAG TPA: Ig-like domain-containing protein, partial [Terriglobales bacterium]|nr:Ig-like domain-containing protein [Terriglobales bacterium]